MVNPGEIALWDLGPSFALAFAADGHTLAAAGYDRAIRVWDLAVRRRPYVFRGHDDYVWSVAFAPDGHTLASASWDGTVKLWDPNETQQSTSLYDPGPDEAPSSYSVAFSPDGRLLASAAFEVTLWDVPGMRRIQTLADYKSGDICLAFSPDARVLAAAGTDPVITLWDTASWRTITTLVGHSGKVCSLSFSPNGKLLASGGGDQTFRLWDWERHREIARVKAHADGQELAILAEGGDQVWSAAFTPDGAMLAAGLGKEVRLWRTIK